MLKSLSTQFVATLFFGPLGLAYSSVALAVFLTLVMAVLFFALLGPLAAIIMWPVAIVAGLILVKLHNDQITSSGSTLLLGPDEVEEPAVSTFGSWGRGVAVLSMLAVGGYLAFWYSGQTDNAAGASAGNFANGDSADSTLIGSADGINSGQFSDNQFGNGRNSGQGNSQNTSQDNSELAIAKTYPIDGDEFTGSSFEAVSSESDSTFTVLTSGQQESGSAGFGSSSQASGGALLYVASQMVNLREGPGTNFSVLDQVVLGDELAEVERAGSWIRVNATESGASGWIFGRLVSTQR